VTANWSPGPSPRIALSLVYVGVQGIRGDPRVCDCSAPAVFAFGLVHGLGPSTRLQDLEAEALALVADVLDL
jgi:hypothetical protein